MKSESLEQLLQRPWVWRGRGHATPTAEPPHPTGHPALDAVLEQGWPCGALTEVLVQQPGCGELSLLLPALRRLCANRRRVVWIAPPWLPYAPALAQQGLDARWLHVLRCQVDDELWAAEQALRSGACAAVLCWPRRIDDRQFRRLQLAAEAGRCWGVVFRRSRQAGQHSPAALRLAVEASRDQTRVRLLKRRGGGRLQAIKLPRLAGTCRTELPPR